MIWIYLYGKIHNNFYRQFTNNLPTDYRQLAVCRLTDRYRYEKNCRPTVGQQLANCRPTVGRLSADSQPTVGQQSVEVSCSSLLPYTNTQICKIGFRVDELCTFCETERETLYHLLYQCTYARQFWNEFELYWHRLSNQVVHLTLENVLFGILSTPCPSHMLLNYFIIIGKLFLWDCRRTQIHPKIQGFQNTIAIKYNIKRKISKKKFYEKKWIFK